MVSDKHKYRNSEDFKYILLELDPIMIRNSQTLRLTIKILSHHWVGSQDYMKLAEVKYTINFGHTIMQ